GPALGVAFYACHGFCSLRRAKESGPLCFLGKQGGCGDTQVQALRNGFVSSGATRLRRTDLKTGDSNGLGDNPKVCQFRPAGTREALPGTTRGTLVPRFLRNGSPLRETHG